MAITQLEFMNGLFSLIFVIISTIVGLRIVSKYFKIRNRIFLFMGLCWVLIVAPWWGSSISFLSILITNKPLNIWLYIFANMVFVPIFLLLLVTAFTDMQFQEQQKIIQGIFLAIAVFFYIYLFYYLLVDVSVLGELQGNVDATYFGILRYFLIFAVFTIAVVGILIARASIKMDDPETKLKGKFLLMAFIFWSIGAICDAALTLTIITLPIVRIIMIMSSIFFYLGYLMPSFIKKAFLKEKV